MSKKRLGKGLDALLPNDNIVIDSNQSKIIEISIDDIEPNPYQPRKEFDQEQLIELSQSIKEHGLSQPISVKKIGSKYQLIAGERRLRASKIANLKTISAIVKDYDEKQMMEIALIENIQREDLNPIEEAIAYAKLIEQFNLTQEEVSARVSKSRSAIANTIRLLNLPKIIQEYVSRETLSMGHARALLGLNDQEKMIKISEKVIKENFSVRQLEEYIKTIKKNKKAAKHTEKRKKNDGEVQMLEQKIKRNFGVTVKLAKDKNAHRLTIDCKNSEDFDKLIKLLSGEKE